MAPPSGVEVPKQPVQDPVAYPPSMQLPPAHGALHHVASSVDLLSNGKSSFHLALRSGRLSSLTIGPTCIAGTCAHEPTRVVALRPLIVIKLFVLCLDELPRRNYPSTSSRPLGAALQYTI